LEHVGTQRVAYTCLHGGAGGGQELRGYGWLLYLMADCKLRGLGINELLSLLLFHTEKEGRESVLICVCAFE
jgi:hypothetical protein